MCPPILIAGIGTMMSVVGSIQAGQAAKAQADAQAEAYRRQAGIEMQTGDYQAARRQEQTNKTIGTQTAMVGGSGVTLDGSPADVIGSTASEGALDTSAIRWNARNQADPLNYQAKLANISGKNAVTGSYFNAAGNLFGGLGTMGKLYDPNRTMFGNVFGYGSA